MKDSRPRTFIVICGALQALATAIQNRMAEVFHVDIHPAARSGLQAACCKCFT